MKEKFVAFTRFTETVLPHEVTYLMKVQAFEDLERLAILKRMQHNCEPQLKPLAYDESIDKRKYSHLKNWITQRLELIDVDKQYAWLSHLDHEIMTGSITAEGEQQVLKRIERADGPIFHFVKWYDMLRHFRQYLLSHMRYRSHGLVMDYLQDNKIFYHQAQARIEQLHAALLDIVQYYTTGTGNPDQHEDWLNGIYFDPLMDGYSRHLARVRLSILHVAKRQYGKLLEVLDFQDQNLQNGKMYARRVLLEYYSNRLILCNRLDQLDEAVRFGYLSLRGDYPSSLQYRSNLAAVLLRRGEAQEALSMLKSSFARMKQSTQGHDKVSFVTMYLRSLHALGQLSQAERYADAYLKNNREMVFAHNWHSFFQIYMKVLFSQENYRKALRVGKKYDVENLERAQMGDGKLLPFMQWYMAVGSFKEQKIGKKLLTQRLMDSLQSHPTYMLTGGLAQLTREVGQDIPMIIEEVLSTLKKEGLIH